MRPLQMMVHVEVEVFGSNVKLMLPVPALVFGGTSLVPLRVAVHEIRPAAAWTGAAPIENKQSNAARLRIPRVRDCCTEKGSNFGLPEWTRIRI